MGFRESIGIEICLCKTRKSNTVCQISTAQCTSFSLSTQRQDDILLPARPLVGYLEVERVWCSQSFPSHFEGKFSGIRADWPLPPCWGLTEQRLYYFRQMHTIYTMTSDWWQNNDIVLHYNTCQSDSLHNWEYGLFNLNMFNINSLSFCLCT